MLFKGGEIPNTSHGLSFHHEMLFPELLLHLLWVSFDSHFALSINTTSLVGETLPQASDQVLPSCYWLLEYRMVFLVPLLTLAIK